jgi:S-DNA-T family DNA segregation ATPase FtsK/SpoIIIE
VAIVHIVLRSAAGDRDVEVSPRSPDATVDDLLRAALGARRPQEVAIAGHWVAGSTPIEDSGLHEGAILDASHDGPRPPARGAPEAGFELAVLAGLDAGRAYPLPAGRVMVGRSPDAAITLAHATVSARHCVLELGGDGHGTVTDEGSTSGTYVDGRPIAAGEPVPIGPGAIIEVGAIALAIRPVRTDDRPRLDLRRQVGPGGTVPHNRPPRHPRAPSPETIEVPREPSEPAKAHFSLASTVGPLVMAVVMIGVTGNPQYALFMLLTPIIAVGTYAESRRRNTKGGQKSQAEYETEVRTLETRVQEASEMERARLRDRCPDPAEVVRRAALPSVRLWERRQFHEHFLALYAGLTDLPWKPPVKDGVDKLPEELSVRVAENRLPVAPVEVDLAN